MAMALTRRAALIGLGGAAVLGCGGALSWLTLGYHLAPGDVPIGLDAKHLAIVRAIVETLAPADGDLPSGVSLGVHQRIDEELWSVPDEVREDLRAAIALIEHLPPLFGSWGRFTRLPRAEREAYYERLLQAGPRPVVQAAVALKQMCTFFYYNCPETWAAIGYDGPWVQTAKPPASSERYAELLAAARGA
jgi:hypothetical protein